MDEIEEDVVRIFYLFKGYLFLFLFLEIIFPDIMLLSDIDDTISRKSSLLIRVRIEVNFCYRC